MRYLLILCFLLSGCTAADVARQFSAALPVPTSGTPPIVTARESATSIMTIIACPATPTGVSIISEMVSSLSQQSPIVTATEAGTARLTINTCPTPPTPEAIRAAAEAVRAQRTR